MNCNLAAPVINPSAVLTRTRGSRIHRPFVKKNATDLQAKLSAPCPRCGYTGPAIRIHPRDGGRHPSTSVHSSRTAFVKALLNSDIMCCNCSVEVHGKPRPNPKRRAATWGISLANTLAAIADEA